MNYSAFERLAQEKQTAILNAGTGEFSSFSYSDANTDRITAACGISKGLLYHYFGTKKGFYLFCLGQAMDTLTAYEPPRQKGDFYAVLFAEMEQKVRLCSEHPAETQFIQLASRESAVQVATEKNELLKRYSMQMQRRSYAVLSDAAVGLPLKSTRAEAIDALLLYSNAMMGRYMAKYQDAPAIFFSAQEEIKTEIKRQLDWILYGICEEASK